MLLSAAKITSVSPLEFGTPKELKFRGMGTVEKNWAMFTPPTATGSTVRAIYSVYPHRIASVNLATGRVAFVATSESKALAKLANKLGTSPTEFHGGAGVTHIKESSGNEYYLCIFHVVARSNGGRKAYWNYPYKFSVQAPHQVLHVGKRIELQMLRNPAYAYSMVAFVTTVLHDHGDIFIAYGAGDRSSRTLRLPLRTFDAEYFPSSLQEGEDEIVEDLDLDDLEFLDFAEFGSKAVTCNSEAFVAHCSDSMTPSICRSCSEPADEADTEVDTLSEAHDEADGEHAETKDEEKKAKDVQGEVHQDDVVEQANLTKVDEGSTASQVL